METEYIKKIAKNEVLFKQGQDENDMYILDSGKLIVLLRKGSQVTPLAHINAGEYIGELSFFDSKTRSADVIALEDCVLIKISSSQMQQKIPSWLMHIGKFQATKLRILDQVIQKKGIKKQNVESMKPLSIEEQRQYVEILK